MNGNEFVENNQLYIVIIMNGNKFVENNQLHIMIFMNVDLVTTSDLVAIFQKTIFSAQYIRLINLMIIKL